MQILPIDFVLDDRELTRWHNTWSIERYGAGCLTPERYYKNYADVDRFVTDCTPKEGDENILSEKAERDRVLELLLRMRKLTRELKGIGASRFLSLQEIKQKREERGMLYREYIEIAQGETATNNAATEHKQETEREKKYFAKAIDAGMMEKTYNGYRWIYNNGLKASLAYFLNKVFNPDGFGRIPYKRLECLFEVKCLAVAVSKLLEVKKEQKWRAPIDALFQN